MPLAFRRPSSSALSRALSAAAARPLTYPEVGASAGRLLPSGYRHDRSCVDIGIGVWSEAVMALRTWSVHRNAGVQVTPDPAPLVPGTDVVVTVRIGPAWMTAPCRIVTVTDQPDRFGFAYGTLPGHPERGEESFHVIRREGEAVAFEIVAFSRPGSRLVRLGGPVSRAAQRRATRRYLKGMEDAVRAGTSGVGPGPQ